MCVYIYIYRERDMHTCVYVYVHLHMYIHTYSIPVTAYNNTKGSQRKPLTSVQTYKHAWYSSNHRKHKTHIIDYYNVYQDSRAAIHQITTYMCEYTLKHTYNQSLHNAFKQVPETTTTPKLLKLPNDTTRRYGRVHRGHPIRQHSAAISRRPCAQSPWRWPQENNRFPYRDRFRCLLIYVF